VNILLVCHEFPPVGGGGGRAVMALARALADRHTVDCITESAVGLPPRERLGALQVHRVFSFWRDDLDVPPFRSHAVYPVSGLACGLRLIRRTRYDLVNSHFAVPSGLLGAVLARFARVPHVVSVHGADIYEPCRRISPHRFRALGAVVRCVLHDAAAIVAQSRDTAFRVCRHYGASLEARVRVIPLAFDADEVLRLAKLDSREDVRPPGSDGRQIAAVGRLVERKAFDRLILSMRHLPDSVRLVIIGSGPLRAMLEGIIRREGLEGRVSLPGHVDDSAKYRYLRGSDVYVLSSHHEGFGVVIQEAMAVGLPIVAHARGGQTDLIEDGVNGILTPDNEPETLAAAIRRLLEDDGLRQRMGQRNLEKIRRYSPAKIAGEYLALFQQVVRRACP